MGATGRRPRTTRATPAAAAAASCAGNGRAPRRTSAATAPVPVGGRAGGAGGRGAAGELPAGHARARLRRTRSGAAYGASPPGGEGGLYGRSPTGVAPPPLSSLYSARAADPAAGSVGRALSALRGHDASRGADERRGRF